jgi:hypothetical protein
MPRPLEEELRFESREVVLGVIHGLKNLLQISSLKWAHDVYILRKIKPHLVGKVLKGVGIVTDILVNGLLYSQWALSLIS